MTVEAVTPNGVRVRATYREDATDWEVAYVRKAGRIISGRLRPRFGSSLYVFTPLGKNAKLLN
jgi:hypothetical protein